MKKQFNAGGAWHWLQKSSLIIMIYYYMISLSLVAKHVTPHKWANLGGHKTGTSGFTLGQAIACAVQFDDQHCGIYAGDADSYKDFGEVFTPLICEYHGLDENFSHTSDMDSSKIKGNINGDAPVKSTRIRVGRSIEGTFLLNINYAIF